MEKGKFWPPTESKPLNRSTKNWHTWLCPGDDALCQIWCNMSTGGIWANRWNTGITLLTFYLFIYVLFFVDSPTGHTSQRILTCDGSKTRFHARTCLFGIKNLKLTTKPFYAPKGQILAKNSKIYGRKRFTMAMLTCKRPLIVIVAP